MLGLDAAGPVYSLALVDGQEVLAARNSEARHGRAETLFPDLRELLRSSGRPITDLVAIGVNTGPGDFTGTRLGVSAARGLAMSLGIPAIGIGAFDLLPSDAPPGTLAVVGGSRRFIYARLLPDGCPARIEMDELPQRFPEVGTVVGQDPEMAATLLGARASRPTEMPSLTLARITRARLPHDGSRPVPTYLGPAASPKSGISSTKT